MRRLVSLAIAVTALAANFALADEIAYVERDVTTYQGVQRRVIVPVREFRQETRLHGWWNPLREPHVATHYVPTTRWEERIETSYVPIVRRQYVAQKLTGAGTVSPPIVFAKPAAKPVERTASRPLCMVDIQPLVPIAK